MGILTYVSFALSILLLCMIVYLYLLQRKTSKLYADLFSVMEKVDSQKTKHVFEQLLQKNKEAEIRLNDISAELKNVTSIASSGLQRTGLVRFNPFTDTGGNHSFSLCLLDKLDNGMIITAIHGREGTRLYTKLVSNGKSNQTLSAEEKKSLLAAQK